MKYLELNNKTSIRPSLPSRERGLKSTIAIETVPSELSLPSRERGLKFFENNQDLLDILSLPSRERGLKSGVGQQRFYHKASRSLRGSVD